MTHPLECIEAEMPPTMPSLAIVIGEGWGRQQKLGCKMFLMPEAQICEPATCSHELTILW